MKNNTQPVDPIVSEQLRIETDRPSRVEERAMKTLKAIVDGHRSAVSIAYLLGTTAAQVVISLRSLERRGLVTMIAGSINGPTRLGRETIRNIQIEESSNA